MKPLTKDMNPFEKMEIVERKIKLELPQINLTNLSVMFGRISHYVKGNRNHLNSDERLLYDFLLKHKLNIRNVYQWFLLRNAPADLKKRVIEKKVWLRHALSEMGRINRIKENPNDSQLLTDIKKIINEVV